MSWLRWWDGTCSDPKWRVVAARSRQPVGNVLAIWAWLLEQARPNEGALGEIDCETIAVTYGYEVEGVAAIVTAMGEKGLIEDAKIKAWSKRQPKREDDSRERVAAWRAKKQGETQKAVPKQQDEARNDDVTHGNAPEAEAEAEADNKNLVGSPAAKKRQAPNRALAYPSEFELVWREYPFHPNASKKLAYLAWQDLPEEDRDKCFDGALAYGRFLDGERQKRPEYPGQHLVNFIKQRKFESLLEVRQ